MFDDRSSFLSRTYLQSMLDLEFRGYVASGKDEPIRQKLLTWANRNKGMSETQSEAAFIKVFFEELWGHGQSGAGDVNSHTLMPKFAVEGGGAKGATGAADLALGWFRGRSDAVPQVLCEFKDIRSKLDQKQNRKGANFTPIEQCLNYVRAARRKTWGNEPVQAWWGLVSDMNEFRLYWWDWAPQAYMRFVIQGDGSLFEQNDLLADNKDAAFDRFLFQKLLHRDQLISESGKPALWRLVERQRGREHKIEEEFYAEYKDFRDHLFKVLIAYNIDFPASRTELLRTTQRVLDRFIFAFYCEDMGERMLFPPQFIRDYLTTRSIEPYYEQSGTDIWDFMKRLFAYMNTGGQFGQKKVPHINGGLFADDPLINCLHIPNSIFAVAGQGQNEASLSKEKKTLLFLSAYYNYAAKGDGQQSLTLYTLGRIFEQSITELEYKVGEIEGRDTLAKLSKRKRDGVYYTPEWVVSYLVRETLEPWFKEARASVGWGEDDLEPKPEVLKAYLAKLRTLKVVDPACGSGAFLIGAFRKLLEERSRLAAMMQVRAIKDDAGISTDEAKLVADILSNNLFGVDINPASVEIAKLALWLHTARANAPLSTLNDNIVCGNSLVASDCWAMIARDAEAEARINPFDWQGRFAEGGFDIVLGNPPYVKLQNLMKVDKSTVAYLTAQRPVGTYESTQTGNFDLYLPFIEKGLRLLREGGRMAYIAPSLWTVNEYGQGLRRLIHRTKQLERWLDFKSYQVFDEAITYTALQFYTKAANSVLRVANSPDGQIGPIDQRWAANEIGYVTLSPDVEWDLNEVTDRELISKISANALRLDDKLASKAIVVGIQTSADHIYHLEKLGRNSYRSVHPEHGEREVEIEDAIMRPLISGPDAKRYIEPSETLHLLFPYEREAGGAVKLVGAANLQKKFPKAWRYLSDLKIELRARENGKMDGEDWYAYNYPKNLDKQEFDKLIVAQTVPSMRVTADFDAKFYLNNVRVNGILPSKQYDLACLLGAMNGNAVDYVFRRKGKPKQGGWFEANKQFIAPLPVPRATPAQQKVIGAKARKLQELWTSRRDLLVAVQARLSVLPRLSYKPKFLWPDLPSLRDIKLPKTIKESEIAAAAKEELAELVAAKIDALQGFIDLGTEFEARFSGGELRLTCDGRVVLSKIFLNEQDGPLVETYWRFILSERHKEAKTLASKLGAVPSVDSGDAAKQFMAKVKELLSHNAKLMAHERDMNEALYELYGLSKDERQLIEDDCAKRPLL